MKTQENGFFSYGLLCVFLMAMLFAASEAFSKTCTYSLAPANLKAKSQLEYYSIRVKTSPDCSWTAGSNRDWVTFPAPPTGTGQGSFKIEVAANPTDMKRVAHVFIGAKGMTITQEPMSCSYQISQTQVTVAPAPSSGQVQVQTASGCRWMAASSAPAWLTPAYTSGRGPGTIQYHVGRYAGTSDRTGRITVGGKTLVVRQKGCSYSLSPAQRQISSNGGTADFQIMTQPSCPWMATCTADWITITKGDSSQGNTLVMFSASTNTSNQQRSATIRAAGKNFKVIQNGLSAASVQ
ncbi:MAG: BACON domain-containing protein [Deltaproteobacteria bacterium]|nr:BACON domain-containing protein [Deltaproteobacteria bacterium]